MSELEDVLKAVGDKLLVHELPRLDESRAIQPPNSIGLPDNIKFGPGSDLLTHFERSREIDLPWADLIDLKDVVAVDELAQFKAEFEASWNGNPLYQTKSNAQFIELAAKDVGTRLLGIAPSEVLLSLPGPARADANIESKGVVTQQVEYRKFPFVGKQPVITTSYTLTRRYLGPDPKLCWRFFKLTPKQAGGAPLPFNFWGDAASYETAWKNVDSIVKVAPVAEPFAIVEVRSPMKGLERTSRTPQEIQPFDDVEANAAIPDLALKDAKAVFEAQLLGQVLADIVIGPETSFPITLSKAADGLFAAKPLDNGQIEKAPVPDATILLRLAGKDAQTYRVLPLPHIANTLNTLFEKLVGKQGLNGYQSAWEIDIASVERVYTAKEFEGAKTDAKYLDLMAAFIRRHFWDIDARIELTTELVTQAKANLPKSVDVIRGSLGEVEDVIERYRDLQTRKIVAEFEMRKLVDAAKALGYVLNTAQDPITVKMPPDTPAEKTPDSKIKKGELYREFTNKVSWYESRRESATKKRNDLESILRKVSPLPLPPLPPHPYIEIAADVSVSAPGFALKSLSLGGGLGGIVRKVAGLGSRLPHIPGFPPLNPFDLLGGGAQNAPRVYQQLVTKEYTDYKIQNSAQSPVEEFAAKQREQGAAVFQFELTDDGYVDPQGRTLGEIMHWCRLDEGFRTRCAVLIPRYRQTLLGGRIPIGYHAIKAPRPGNSIVEPPELVIQDRLSFVTHWLGTELGVPIDSINLAPGETRTVTLTREYAAASRNASEVLEQFDVTESYSTSFSTEFERTLRHETEKSSSTNWSAHASGSYMGIVEGGVKGGGESKKTVTDFAQDVQKSAQKAASEITRKSQNKISTTTSDESSIKTIDSSSSQVSNVNAGATLNLTFYQLNNVFASAVLADRIRIGVSSGIELIEGTGIVERRIVPFEQLDAALDVLVSAPAFEGPLAKYRAPVAAAALDALLQVLNDDYAIDAKLIDLSQEPEIAKKLATAGMPENKPFALFAGYFKSNVDPTKKLSGEENERADAAAWSQVLDSKIETLQQAFRRWSDTPLPISRSLLRLPSSAVHMDSRLGEGRATEQYADAMRHAEWDGRRAQTDTLRAGAELQRAQASAIASGSRFVTKGRFQLSEPRIRDVSDSAITLTASLPAGSWALAADEMDPIYLGPTHEGKDKVMLKNVTIKKGAAVSLVETGSGIFIGK